MQVVLCTKRVGRVDDHGDDEAGVVEMTVQSCDHSHLLGNVQEIPSVNLLHGLLTDKTAQTTEGQAGVLLSWCNLTLVRGKMIYPKWAIFVEILSWWG